MKPAAYMVWAPFTGPAQFTTDPRAPAMTAWRAGYTCTPLITEHDALAAVEQAQQWQLAVDQLLSGWHSTADSYASPHEAIKALIAFEVTAALDPKVSSDAAALVDQARREALEEAEKVCESLSAVGGDEWTITRSKAFHDAAVAIQALREGK